MLGDVIAFRLWRERDTRWSVVVAMLAGVCLVCTLVSLLAHVLSTAWQPMLILAAMSHQLGFSAPIALVLFAVLRRWYACAASAAALLAVVLVQAPLYIAADPPRGGTLMTILQANLRVGNADPQALVRDVSAHQVDVLMTEELTPTERDALLFAGLAEVLPYRFDASLAGGGGGLAIWSRTPLSDEHNYPHFQMGVLSATMHTSDGAAVTVVAVHLLPPYPYPSITWVHEIARLKTLLQVAADNNATAIVGGDFNATTDHRQFRDILDTGYQDAAEHTGAGYLASYPTDRWFPPVIAIDHVITRRAPASDATTLSLPGSDHKALLVHLRLQH
jgi:endonuclease/exonuclease/phosphatase (EEP) superfamily protein YafD